MSKTTLVFKGIEIEVEYTYHPGSVTNWDEAPEPEEITLDGIKLGPDDLWKWFEEADWMEELETLLWVDVLGYSQAA